MEFNRQNRAAGDRNFLTESTLHGSRRVFPGVETFALDAG